MFGKEHQMAQTIPQLIRKIIDSITKPLSGRKAAKPKKTTK
jgi:hypothetical protein